ncbi:ATP-binding cassette domain-containing protein [Corynebacterium sp. S7]
MRPVLQAKSLSVSTVSGQKLVDQIELEVFAGERVALIGSSGSGKSLLASSLAGVTPPTLESSGEVYFDGKLRARNSSGINDLVLVRQDSADALNPLVRVGKQLAIPFRSLGEKSDQRIAEKSQDLLNSVGLEDPERILRSFPGQLSGGQRQRVCIALGLACRPRLLITDECTTALDLISQARVLTALKEVSTLVFITHDLSVAAQLCERVVVFDAGRIVEDTTLKQLFDDPHHPVSRALTQRARKAMESVA